MKMRVRLVIAARACTPAPPAVVASLGNHARRPAVDRLADDLVERVDLLLGRERVPGMHAPPFSAAIEIVVSRPVPVLTTRIDPRSINETAT